MQKSLLLFNALSVELTRLGYHNKSDEGGIHFPVPNLLCRLAQRIRPCESGASYDQYDDIVAQLYFSTDLLNMNRKENTKLVDRRLAITVSLDAVQTHQNLIDLSLFTHFLNERCSIGQYHLSDADQKLYYRIILPTPSIGANSLQRLFDEILSDINMHIPALEAIAYGHITYTDAMRQIISLSSLPQVQTELI